MPSQSKHRNRFGGRWKTALLLLSLLPPASPPAKASPFSDLPAGHWASQAVQSLEQKGIFQGYSGGVFNGNRAMTRFETAALFARALSKMEQENQPLSGEDLKTIKEIFAQYQDELDRLGIRLRALENHADELQTRVEEAERVQAHGEFATRNVATSAQELSSNFGPDTTFTLSHLARPYSIFPDHGGSASTSRAYLNVGTNLANDWTAQGRIAAYTMVGDTTNALAWGAQPPYFQNPFAGYSLRDNLAEEEVSLENRHGVFHFDLGTFTPQHSPSYLYAGVPNLTEEGPDYLPIHGGRAQAQIKNYLIISEAFAELYAGRLAQSSPWQTGLYGANLGIGLFGFTAHLHWMNTQNDPASFAAGTSGLVTTPINNGGGWVSPTSLSPITVGPQKQRSWGLDLFYKRSFEEHPITAQLSYGNSNYKPNTNTGVNAMGELWRAMLKGDLTDNLTLGVEYLNVGPKYSPMLLPLSLPNGITLSNFPWQQWPFSVDYAGYYTLQDSQAFPQNRQGFKGFFHQTFPRGELSGSYRILSQTIASQLTNFNNDVDIQSLGFYEPLFPVTGSRSGTFLQGKTRDWSVSSRYDLFPRLALKLGIAGMGALRQSNDVNNIDFNAWLGDAGVAYSWPTKWKFEVTYHRGQGNGRNLDAPASPENAQFVNSGEIVKLDFPAVNDADAFLQFRTFFHSALNVGNNYRLWQLLGGMNYGF